MTTARELAERIARDANDHPLREDEFPVYITPDEREIIVTALTAQPQSPRDIDPAELWERYLAETDNPSPQGAMAFAVDALTRPESGQ